MVFSTEPYEPFPEKPRGSGGEAPAQALAPQQPLEEEGESEGGSQGQEANLTKDYVASIVRQSRSISKKMPGAQLLAVIMHKVKEVDPSDPGRWTYLSPAFLWPRAGQKGSGTQDCRGTLQLPCSQPLCLCQDSELQVRDPCSPRLDEEMEACVTAPASITGSFPRPYVPERSSQNQDQRLTCVRTERRFQTSGAEKVEMHCFSQM